MSTEIEMMKKKIIRSFPKRWFMYGGIQWDRLLNVLARGLIEGSSAVSLVQRELSPETAVTTLDEKERTLGLTNGAALPLEERRKRIIAREQERGGATNQSQFETGLKLLTGYDAKFVPDYSAFSMIIEFDAPPSAQFNFGVLNDYIRRNKLAHIAHQIATADNKEINLFFGTVIHTGKTMTIRQGG